MGQRKRKEQEPSSVSGESLPAADAKESIVLSPTTPDTVIKRCVLDSLTVSLLHRRWGSETLSLTQDHEAVPNKFLEEEERLRHDRENHTKTLLQVRLDRSSAGK